MERIKVINKFTEKEEKDFSIFNDNGKIVIQDLNGKPILKGEQIGVFWFTTYKCFYGMPYRVVICKCNLKSIESNGITIKYPDSYKVYNLYEQFITYDTIFGITHEKS